MSVYQDLVERKTKLSLIGLGYVGMPIAVEFAKHIEVVGFDVNEEKIRLYRKGVDPTKEVGDEAISSTGVDFTSNPERLREARFHIVAVPTPIDQDKTPDLSPVVGASTMLGRHLEWGSIVVFESTVYPGVTEDVCVPILERESGLRCGVDFKVGYSPERINPGDKVHTLTTIRKIVSGMDDESLEEIKRVYDIVIEAGTYPVSSIKTAEAIKVVENSQRDINIAFMNELAMVFDRMGIDTSEVVEGMGGFVAETAIREMVRVGLAPKSSNVVVLGITFKENCPDVRNSKVYDIVMRLKEYGVEPSVVDPWASGDEVKQVYGMQLRESGDIANADCLIVAVAHDEFKELGFERIDAFFGDKPDESKVLLDVKGILDAKRFSSYGSFWRL